MKVNINLSLAPLDLFEALAARAWRNDWRIWKWCRQLDLISYDEQNQWFEKQSADPTVRMYRLVLKASGTDETVGICGLTSIDHVHRRAEFSLYIRPDRQRLGYARAGLSLLLDHGFKNLGLHQIWGESFDGNPALKLFQELGFKFDGTRRQFYFKDGRFIDAHLVSILAEEWHGRHSTSGSSDIARRASAADPGASQGDANTKPSGGCDPREICDGFEALT